MLIHSGRFHRLVCPFVIKAFYPLHDHVGQDGNGMVADHTPGLVAIERPDREHLLYALIIMRQHRVGDIGVYILMHKVEPGMQGTVGVPQRQGCIVRETFSLFDVLVQPSETAVGILEKERVQGGVIGGRVECFFRLLVGCDPVFLQFLLPKVYSFISQTVECHTVQLLHVQLCSGGADCGNGSFDSHFFAFFRCKGKASHQVLSPGFV